MKEDIEAQGKLKRARLESAKKNSQLMDTNIEELGNAELRDSQVQTKVRFRFKNKRLTIWGAGIPFGCVSVCCSVPFSPQRLRCHARDF